MLFLNEEPCSLRDAICEPTELGLSGTVPDKQKQKSDPKVAFLFGFQGVQQTLIEADMAQRTGLEPATPGVTGRYSNRLNYRCASAGLSSVSRKSWWLMTGSNRRPPARSEERRVGKEGSSRGTAYP